ncbi:diacylglycerol/lipid kinase family protein [Rhodopirellula islandica]|uniref:diacylglycerol/lipid kinase family protein n=1 Tax=Rhodopirellula islandica TaxID=595434 RepID=UPI00064A8D4F|nr:diacylglycerol kinase family protein [Rhodopirellula islandica]
MPAVDSKRKIREVWIFTSPKAGSGAGRGEILRLIELCRAGGLTCRRIDNLVELAERVGEADSLPDDVAVVGAGGDGTLALLAGKLPPGSALIPMPMGTENLLARYYRYSRRAEDVLATIRQGDAMRVDAGRANGRLFLVMVTAGFDAEVVRAMHLTRRGHINRFSYAGPLWRAIRRYAFPVIDAEMEQAMPVSAPEKIGVGTKGRTTSSGALERKQTVRTSGCWMMAFNLPCYAASLPIEPEANGNDGQLDLINLAYGSVIAGLRYLMALPGGRHLKRSDVFRYQATKIIWSSLSRVPYQVDGDYAGRLPVQIEVLPDHVTLLRAAN